MGEPRDLAERGNEGRCEERAASLAWCEAKPLVSDVVWLPLVSDALATAKHGKAVGSHAPSLPSFSRLEEYGCSCIWLGWQLKP